MTIQIIHALPEILLFTGVLHLLFLYILSYDSAKIFAGCTRFWLLASLFCLVLFYNQSFLEPYFAFNSYTLLFSFGAGIFLYIALIFSASWFVNENKTGCQFYILVLLSALNMILFLGACHLFSLLFCYILLVILERKLLYLNYDQKNITHIFGYQYITLFMLLLFVSGICGLYMLCNGNLDYQYLKDFISHHPKNIFIYLSVLGIIIPLLYELGIAPFHIMEEEKAGKSILPVAHYMCVILPIMLWGGFIKFNQLIFPAYESELSWAYLILALFSVILGAIGANSRINLRRVVAYGALYSNGIILLLIAFKNQDAQFTAILLLFMSLLAYNGLYTIFYGLKSHGEYLYSISSLSGLAQTRSYTAGALIVCLFSLLGLPPMVGFLSFWIFLYETLSISSYVCLGIVLLFWLVLSMSYLEIIKTVYFERKIKNFDTENRYILLETALNISALLLLTFNPFHILEKLKDMFYVIFL